MNTERMTKRLYPETCNTGEASDITLSRKRRDERYPEQPLCEEVAFVVGFQWFGHDKLRMFLVLVMGASQKLAPPSPGYIL